MDELAQTYIKRMDRVKCNPEYKMIINDDTRVIESVEIISSGECEVPLFINRNFEIDSKSVDSIEQIGNDPKTAWIKLIGGKARSVKFTNKALWGGKVQTIWSKYRFIILGIAFLLVVFIFLLYLFISKRRYVFNKS